MAKASLAPVLKVVVLNAENLFVFMDRWAGVDPRIMTEPQWQLSNAGLLDNKPLVKLHDLAQSIRQLDADLILLTEVGGLVSLQNFNQHFLGNQYQCFLEEGNSDRGIDMGFLVRGPWEYKIKSHRDHPLPHPKIQRFSRDVLRLELGVDNQPWFNVLLVHLKSKLNMRGEDFEGRTRRAIEVRALAQLAHELDQQVPLLLGGDFNGIALLKDPEPEFLPLYHLANLKDAAEVAQVPDEERFSYVHFRSGLRVLQQLDYLFLNSAAQTLLVPESVQFPRYQDAQGNPLPVPKFYDQKRQLPSDHFPLYAEFDLTRHSLWKA